MNTVHRHGRESQLLICRKTRNTDMHIQHCHLLLLETGTSNCVGFSPLPDLLSLDCNQWIGKNLFYFHKAMGFFKNGERKAASPIKKKKKRHVYGRCGHRCVIFITRPISNILLCHHSAHHHPTKSFCIFQLMKRTVAENCWMRK